VNKIVRGKENLSLETICKVEKVLEMELIDVPQYKEFSELNMTITSTSVSEQIVSKNKADKVYNQQQDYHSFLEVTTSKKPSLSLVA